MLINTKYKKLNSIKIWHCIMYFANLAIPTQLVKYHTTNAIHFIVWSYDPETKKWSYIWIWHRNIHYSAIYILWWPKGKCLFCTRCKHLTSKHKFVTSYWLQHHFIFRNITRVNITNNMHICGMPKIVYTIVW